MRGIGQSIGGNISVKVFTHFSVFTQLCYCKTFCKTECSIQTSSACSLLIKSLKIQAVTDFTPGWIQVLNIVPQNLGHPNSSHPLCPGFIFQQILPMKEMLRAQAQATCPPWKMVGSALPGL